VTGSGLTIPAVDGEVFADPVKGASGPLAVVIRFPGPDTGWDGSGRIQNTTVDGRPGTLSSPIDGRGGADWLLPGGAVAMLRTQDLSAAQILDFAEAISRNLDTPPSGLESVGIAKATRAAMVAISHCEAPMLDIAAINGPTASRYAAVFFSAPATAVRWDRGQTTLLAFGPPETAPTTPPEVHQATKTAWKALIRRAEADERAARNEP
jgi:hypothetical protein